MIIRELRADEKDKYNEAVNHPLQTWEWGDFRQSTGIDIVRLGVFDKSKLVKGYTITFHSVPKTSFTIGYLPKSVMPDKLLFEALEKITKQKKCIFVKIEPDIKKSYFNNKPPDFKKEEEFLTKAGCQKGRPMFTRFNFLLDLKRDEEELLKNMKPKTRYNIRLAQKKGVVVTNDNSEAAFSVYLKLTKETTKRQKFYAHSQEYHIKMWNFLKPAGIPYLLKAKYNKKTLAAWILFKIKDTLYYPYGASSTENREVMASNLMMWETIRFGQKLACNTFDMWGCLGPDPDPKDPWFGFHRFKQGYSPQLVQTVGSWDHTKNLALYNLYKAADKLRWKYLKLKATLPI